MRAYVQPRGFGGPAANLKRFHVHDSAEMLQLSTQEIRLIEAKVGRPRAHGVKIAIDLERVSAMRLAGFSFTQIANYFGVHRATIRRRMREAVLASRGSAVAVRA